MNNGKITVESGNNKAVIEIVKNGAQLDVEVKFEPELDLKKTPTESENFVANIVSLFVTALKG